VIPSSPSPSQSVGKEPHFPYLFVEKLSDEEYFDYTWLFPSNMSLSGPDSPNQKPDILALMIKYDRVELLLQEPFIFFQHTGKPPLTTLSLSSHPVVYSYLGKYNLFAGVLITLDFLLYGVFLALLTAFGLNLDGNSVNLAVRSSSSSPPLPHRRPSLFSFYVLFSPACLAGPCRHPPRNRDHGDGFFVFLHRERVPLEH